MHGVCTNVEDISTWGTLRTTDFPQPYGFNEDCWCKLSADNNQRIVLSVISFQLFPYDPTCSETGLYLQSERNRSKDCTFLQQGHYYISSSKQLYLNFYSRKPAIRAGFWIIYEASDGKSRIRLKCGDTDEVRPALFTRFSTKKELILTPYIYEFASSTSPNLGFFTTTSTMPSTTLDSTISSQKFSLLNQKNFSTFSQTKSKSRNYFTTKKKSSTTIISTSTSSLTKTKLLKNSTTTPTTTSTATTTTSTPIFLNSKTVKTTSHFFSSTIVATSKFRMTKKPKKSTMLNRIFTSQFFHQLTSDKPRNIFVSKNKSIKNQLFTSSTPTVQTTNIHLSDYVLEKINFDSNENLTYEKIQILNNTKSK